MVQIKPKTKYNYIDVHQPKWSKDTYAIGYLPDFGGRDEKRFKNKKDALAWARQF